MCLVESYKLEAQRPCLCAACSLGLLTNTNLRPLLRISGTFNTTFCFNVSLEPPRIFPADSIWAFIFILGGRGSYIFSVETARLLEAEEIFSVNCCQSLSHVLMSNFLRPCGLQPTRLFYPWDSGKYAEVVAISFSRVSFQAKDQTPGLLHSLPSKTPRKPRVVFFANQPTEWN